MALTIPERLAIVFARLQAAPLVNSPQDALALVNSILEQVEDEFSGLPRDPNPGLIPDGRMYPPKADRITTHADGSMHATTRRHEISLHLDGGIEIRVLYTSEALFTKPGGGRDMNQTVESFCDTLRRLYPSAEVNLRRFPSGAYFLDVLLHQKLYMIEYDTKWGYGIGEVKADEGFNSGHPYTSDTWEGATQRLLSVLADGVAYTPAEQAKSA